jgi:hypothetical protein
MNLELRRNAGGATLRLRSGQVPSYQAGFAQWVPPVKGMLCSAQPTKLSKVPFSGLVQKRLIWGNGSEGGNTIDEHSE